MLARPEIGSREHILLWLAGKPADGTFDWNDPKKCAGGQYLYESTGGWWTEYGRNGNEQNFDNLGALAAAACQHRTYGELYEAMRKQWA